MNDIRTPSIPASSSPASPPSDLELMQFFDGELDEPRLSEVRDFVEASGPARNKLGGLASIGDVVRARASSVSATFAEVDLASAVIAQAAAETRLPESRRARGGSRAPLPRTSVPAPSAKGAANDNARRIFVMAGVAAAAAAALVWWGNASGPEDARPIAHVDTTQASSNVAPPESAAPERVDPEPIAAVEPEPALGGVEVASVDFGGRSGAIFHVATDVRGTSTTVLWLSDE